MKLGPYAGPPLGCQQLASASARGLPEGADDYPYLEALYTHLHRNPELSLQEKRTGARMAEEFGRPGCEVTAGVGGYGVVGVCRNGPGPTVLVRADMDALPVGEKTGLAHASRVEAVDGEGRTVGVMHACGHDVHMTVLIGAARRLMAARERWSGTLVLVAQPAEELGLGAAAMLADGLFERFPRPDCNLALHVDPALAAGRVGYTPGYAMAGVDSVDIVVHGTGGHGAFPHEAVDPVVLAARIVLALQTIVSRGISPLEPAVITVGSIHGGSRRNIIPDRVKLELTIRTFDDAVRDRILEALGRLVAGIGMSAGLQGGRLPEVVMAPDNAPALYNDPGLCARAAAAWKRELGEDRVQVLEKKMIGEDFARFGRTQPRVASLLFWLGAADPAQLQNSAEENRPLPGVHSPHFSPALEPTLRTGVHAMTLAVLEMMGPVR